MARLFISQERLDAWSAENKVQIDGERMTLVDLGRTFTIMPAVRFLSVAGGDPDPHDMLGKVKDEEELAALGADLMMTSVIFVDTAYDVQTGFVGAPLPVGG